MSSSRHMLPRITILIEPVTCQKNKLLQSYKFNKTQRCFTVRGADSLGQLAPQLLELLEWTPNSPVLEVP